MAKGERLTKDIYEALRAGAGWNKTLFAVLYDDAGGFYDSVVPPLAPPDAAPCNIDNRPGPGPPPFDTPLRPGRHVGLGYEHDARLLTAAERDAGMAGRSPPMRPENLPQMPAAHNTQNRSGNAADPPDLDVSRDRCRHFFDRLNCSNGRAHRGRHGRC